ncbi:MAG: hypothetical protein BJ554DRAFT_1024 [Olpidium bornovanus]|uniref:Uncharacterized protein n=1 Tax=Olpidium bornovanus TaxID=278681 RepID=A0A8H7ZT44_9FUNG|nr:MAG: hypothetical protein BJ554DRAFT_1024 [Olpidium bornovanus]
MSSHARLEQEETSPSVPREHGGGQGADAERPRAPLLLGAGAAGPGDHSDFSPTPASPRYLVGPRSGSPSYLRSPLSPRDLFRARPSFIEALARAAFVHFFIPFVNGIMLGFGEIAANELAFRYGWFGSRVVLFNGSSASVGVVRQQRGKGRAKDGEGSGVVIGKGGAPLMQT